MSIQDSPDSIVLSLDVKIGSNGEAIGYRAKKTNHVFDFREKYKAEEFFTVIEPNKNGLIFMPKDSFNILSSIEHVVVPPWLACEMASVDDRLGEFRSHYAGYIDPGWAYYLEELLLGKPLTLEIRTYENTFAYHGQPIARIKYERVAELPESTYENVDSNYKKQVKAKLAKQFY
jgi:dCTP deaminase